MSVVGIDFGNQSCYIACARTGGIETISNEFSDRCTPTVVSFGDKQRFAGQAAKNQMVTHMKNTIFNFKRLLGRKYSDIFVQSEKERVPFEICSGNNGDTLIEASYLGTAETFVPQQICAFMLTKLKQIAEKALHTKVVDCVISVPCYYTDAQRRALLDSANIAGLNALRIMNDSCAVALAYGIYKQDLPADEKKPRYVAFVDMGESNLQVCICAFSQGKLRVLCSASDPNLGGRDFDVCLLHHFAASIKDKYHLDVFSKQRAVRRLLQECEKVRKLMSASAIEIPINVECFMNDIDVTAHIKREVFDGLIAPLLDRAEGVMRSALHDCGLKPDQVEFVELVGGCTRTPAIKELVERVFKCTPSTTLNADEAVARGCALQCAILAPTFKVRDYSISDAHPYSITLTWESPNEGSDSVEIFPKFHPFPQSKQLTFFRKEPFELTACYTDSEGVPFPNPILGSFKVNDVIEQSDGESSKVKVKAKLNINGIFTVSSASRAEKVEKEEEPEPEKMEVDPTAKDSSATDSQESAESVPVENGPTEEAKSAVKKEDGPPPKKESPQKKKIRFRYIDLPLQVAVHKMDRNTLNNLIDRERQMQSQDQMEIEKQDAKNSVEEYVYDMRDKLYGRLEKFIDGGEKDKFLKVLDDTENWLYDEGEDESKDVYVNKLSSLKNTGDPVVTRYKESLSRPDAYRALETSLQKVLLAVDLYRKGDEKYDHLDKDDITKVEQCVQEKHGWLQQRMTEQHKLPLHVMPAVYTSQILQEKMSLESTCNPILNKPKPKPPEPPKEEKTPETTEAEKTGEAKPNEDNNAAGDKDAIPEKPEVNPMDLD